MSMHQARIETWWLLIRRLDSRLTAVFDMVYMKMNIMRVHASVCVYVCMCVYIYMYVCMLQVCMDGCMYVCMYVCM